MERLQKIKDKSILGENNLSTYKSEREKDIYKRWTEEFIGEDIRVNSPYIDTNVKANVLEIQGNTLQNPDDLNDIQSVGELQSDGKYKIEVLSRNDEDLIYKIPPQIGKGSYGASGTQIGNTMHIKLAGGDSGISFGFPNSASVMGRDKFCLVGISFNIDITNIKFNFNRGFEIIDNHTIVYKTITYGGGNIDAMYSSSAMGFPNEFSFTIEHIIFTKTDIESTFDRYRKFRDDKKQILLPCQLQKINTLYDRFFYDKNKEKWCIEKRVKWWSTFGVDIKDVWRDVSVREENLTAWHSNYAKGEVFNVLEKYIVSVQTNPNFSDPDSQLVFQPRDFSEDIHLYIGSNTLSNNSCTVDRNGINKYLETNPLRVLATYKTPEIIETEYTDPNLLNLNTYENVTHITSNGGTINTNLKATLGFAKIEPLTKPTNINLSLNGLNAIITWDEIPSAQKYRIFLDSILLAETEYSVFKTNSELNGNITIQAYNHLEESAISDSLYVKTIPNTPANLSVNSTTSIEGYEFNVNFMDYSEIESSYRVDYVIDDGLINSIQVEDNGDSNVEIRCKFKVDDIKKKITIKVVACNDIGENNLLEPITLYISPDFRWTYKKELNQILVSWIDNNEYESAYLLKYSINGGENRFDLVEGYGGSIGETIRHYIQLDRESNIDISICCIIDGKEHIFNKPVRASMDLDKSLISLEDFKYSWIDKGVLEFTWIDNNTCEDGFEFTYRLNDDSEKTIFIDSNSKLETGDMYTYVHTLKEMDSISAKVRTRWDLGNSDYTDSISAIFIPVSGLPPSYVRKHRSNNGVVIEWEAQEYVESYEVHYNQDGKDKIIKTNNNTENIPIDYNIPSLIELFIKTNFVGGVVSNKTKSLIWTPSISTNITHGSIYNKTQDTYNLHSSCIYKIHDKYDIHSSTINNMLQKYFIETVNVTKFLLTQFPYEATIYTKGSKNSFENHVSISNIGVKNSVSIDTVTYTKTVNESIIGTNIFTKLKESYPIESEINQIRIVCFGDSITSGHPGYWAETGTGDPQHCYEYWLDRRLKKAYEVINKGYGSDTTDMMLDRFDKDVLPWNAQFCIIQGGTNDLYWAMAEADGNQVELDKKLVLMKSNIIEMIKRCNDNKIVPVIGTLIPRTGAVGIYKTALYDFNQWIKDYCNSKDIYYIDWFNAGKKNIPPTPLEDPKNPGALNPQYDGDAIYDEYGNIIKQGRGIHPNKQGYKIMGDEIPLSIFRTYDTGLKLYLDKDCLVEEKYNNDDKLNPYYTINVNDLRLSKTKTLIRYVKNVGVNQSLFSLYVARKHNAKVEFIDSNNNKFEYANGLLHSEKIQLIKIDITALREDNQSTVDFYLAGRELKFN